MVVPVVNTAPARGEGDFLLLTGASEAAESADWRFIIPCSACLILKHAITRTLLPQKLSSAQHWLDRVLLCTQDLGLRSTWMYLGMPEPLRDGSTSLTRCQSAVRGLTSYKRNMPA